MAKIIKHNGEIIDGIKPVNGTDFKLEELYQHVGCTIVQMLCVGDKIMWIDEEGKFNQPQNINHEATILLHLNGGLKNDYIAGNAFICEKHEVL
jgi:hypothetical protein